MKKFFAILLFPLIWISMYLYRIVWADLICHAAKAIFSLLMAIFCFFTFQFRLFFVNLLSALWLLITLPITLIVDIPVGLFVCFFGALDFTQDICKENESFSVLGERILHQKRLF